MRDVHPLISICALEEAVMSDSPEHFVMAVYVYGYLYGIF